MGFGSALARLSILSETFRRRARCVSGSRRLLSSLIVASRSRKAAVRSTIAWFVIVLRKLSLKRPFVSRKRAKCGCRVETDLDGGRRCCAAPCRAGSVGGILEMRSRFVAETGIRIRASPEKEIRLVHLRFPDANDRRCDVVFPDWQSLPEH